MAETINYESMLPPPPEDLTAWVLGQGKLNREYLIYKAGREYEPLTDTWRAVVEVLCTACEVRFNAIKIDAGGCHASGAPAPFGWLHPNDGEGQIISGNCCLCPYCGAQCESVHIGRIPSGIRQMTYTVTVGRIPVEGKQDRLALCEWETERYITKDGRSSFHNHLYHAVVVEEKRLVRLVGYNKVFYTISRTEPQQRKTMADDIGEMVLCYPFDPAVLEGTTAENCKLDLFFAQGGRRPVAYLQTWRRHPNAENLVVQGCGKLLDGLLGDNCVYPGGYTARSTIPGLKGIIKWEEVRPHRMLFMSKEEFRVFAPTMGAKKYMLFKWAKGEGLDIDGPDALERMNTRGKYQCREILEEVGVTEFWRTMRYLDGSGRDWHTLRDYWKMARDLRMDLDHGQVRWPKQLKQAHDRVMERKKEKEDEALADNFTRRAEELSGLSWHSDGILIRPCATQKELREEGRALSHCVATYAKSHATGKTAIFFVRREEEPDKPWYTLELDEKQMVVRQNRGKGNCARTPEVQEFENGWLEHIRQLAIRSRKRKEKKTA